MDRGRKEDKQNIILVLCGRLQATTLSDLKRYGPLNLMTSTLCHLIISWSVLHLQALAPFSVF